MQAIQRQADWMNIKDWTEKRGKGRQTMPYVKL